MKSIGENARAGLIPQPVKLPNAITIPANTKPISKAASIDGAFLSTAVAIITYINSAVPRNSTMNIPIIEISPNGPTPPKAPMVDAFGPEIASNAAEAMIAPINCAIT